MQPLRDGRWATAAESGDGLREETGWVSNGYLPAGEEPAAFCDWLESRRRLPHSVWVDLKSRPLTSILKDLASYHRALHRAAAELALARLRERKGSGGMEKIAFAVLGSGARDEQLLGADQDHALVYGGETRPDMDEYAARVGEVTGAVLHQLGYPLCTGNVMASNPRWRGSRTAWRDRIQEYADLPDWDNIRFLLIAADGAAVSGPPEWIEEIRAGVGRAVRDSAFIRWKIANQGLSRGSGLTRMGALRLDQGAFLVKEWLYAPLVNCVRLWALSFGGREPATESRISFLEREGVFSPERASQLREALQVALGLRLRHHVGLALQGRAFDDRIPLSELSVSEQSQLRDALRTVRQLQQSAARQFPKPG